MLLEEVLGWVTSMTLYRVISLMSDLSSQSECLSSVTRLQDCSHILDGVKASILIAMSRDLVLWDTVHCSVDEKLCLLVLCLEWLSEPLF